MPFTVAVAVLDMALQLQLIAEGVGAGIVARRVLAPAPEEQGLQAFRIAGMSFSLEG
jgi:DNA-binding transcriptional LysR family regulator